MAFMVLGVLRLIHSELTNYLRGGATLDLFLANVLLSIRITRGLGIYPRLVRTPDRFAIRINDLATLRINIPDHYVRREYMRHPDYLPRRGWFVIDAGAYVGIYSMWAARRVGDEGLVIALEPNPIAYRHLISNLKLNKVKNVKALPYALGDSVGKATLHVAGENVEASSLIPNHITKNPTGAFQVVGAFTVPVVTMDKLLGMLGIRHVDLVKIDVEGYEMKVLNGARNALEGSAIERFVIEVHKDVVRTRDVEGFLAGYGYVIDKVIRFGDVKDIVYARAMR